MRLVANGTDTRIPADVTTCKMAAAVMTPPRDPREIGAWTWSAISDSDITRRYGLALTSGVGVTRDREAKRAM